MRAPPVPDRNGRFVYDVAACRRELTDASRAAQREMSWHGAVSEVTSAWFGRALTDYSRACLTGRPETDQDRAMAQLAMAVEGTWLQERT